MNYAAILAGGLGARMKRSDLPKQFLMLGKKPIIIHTLEQFLISEHIDEVVVAPPQAWISYTKDIIAKYIDGENRVHITAGGSNRNETIANTCRFIRENFQANAEDIIITHDAVRPFITQRMIGDNIAALATAAAADTVVPAYDTIVESEDGEYIDAIPLRSNMYQGQTPQTFRIDEFMETYGNLSEDEKNTLTDAAKIFVLKGKRVKLVKGELYNLKITTPHDLQVANHILVSQRNGKL